MDAAAQRQSPAKRLNTDRERGSGEQGRAPEPRFLIVGQVIGVHGLRGERSCSLPSQTWSLKWTWQAGGWWFRCRRACSEGRSLLGWL